MIRPSLPVPARSPGVSRRTRASSAARRGRRVLGLHPRGAARRGQLPAVQEGRRGGQHLHRLAHLRAGAGRQGRLGGGAQPRPPRRRLRLPLHARGDEAQQDWLLHHGAPHRHAAPPRPARAQSRFPECPPAHTRASICALAPLVFPHSTLTATLLPLRRPPWVSRRTSCPTS